MGGSVSKPEERIDMESQSAILLRHLNHYCAKALEGAASLCQTRAHAEITPEHWLLKLLEQGEGDLTVIARRYEWDMDAVWQALLGWLDQQPRSVRSRPALSASLESLLKQAWLAASMAGDGQIRSCHLPALLTQTELKLQQLTNSLELSKLNVNNKLASEQ